MHIIYSIRRTIETLLYLTRLGIKEGYSNYVKKEARDKALYILVNGPSLNASLDDIISHRLYDNYDMMSVNFLPNDSRFEIIRPRYHVISDPMFYKGPGQEERVAEFFKQINEKVSWPLTLFVPIPYFKDKEWCKRFYNEHIQLVPFHFVTPPRDCLMMERLFAKGQMGVTYGTVLHQAIYMGVLSGYQQIELYGADHTFFDGLCVNDQNQVCKKTTHFYDDHVEVKPIYHTYTGKEVAYTMAHFLAEYARLFKGHEILNRLSKTQGVSIINATRGSMIDAYERKNNDTL